MTNGRAKVRAFTLAEVMAAMALMMVIASGIYGSLIIGEFMITEARFRADAQMLATDEAWMMFNNSYANLFGYPLAAEFTDTANMRILTATGAIAYRPAIPASAIGIEMDVADVPGYGNSVLARTGVLRKTVATATDHVIITTDVLWNRRDRVSGPASFASESKTIWRYNNDR